MSVLVHRCECGHTDLNHAENFGPCSYGGCKARCRKSRHEVGGPSELLASFADNSIPVTSVTPPGSIFGSTLGGILKTCDCASCHSVFASMGVSA